VKRYIIRYKSTDISEERNASIFRVRAVSQARNQREVRVGFLLLLFLVPEDGGCIFIWILAGIPPACVESHHGKICFIITAMRTSDLRSLLIAQRTDIRHSCGVITNYIPQDKRFSRRWLRRMPSSRMWRRVDLVWTDISEERSASILWVEKSVSEEPAWAHGYQIDILLATCSRWFLASGFFYPEDGGDTFLRNVGSHKFYTAPHPRKRHSSKYILAEIHGSDNLDVGLLGCYMFFLEF
jgi:hypothetical protein